MVKRNKLLGAGLAALALVVVLAVLVLAAPLILYLILPGPGEVKTNSCLTEYHLLNSTEPHYRTQYTDSGNFTFSYHIEPSDDCILLALVDYRAVPFYFNENYNTTQYLGNGSGLPGNYSGVIRMTDLSEGWHDVTLLYFVAPDNFSYDWWGVNADMMLSSSLRFNVIVNNNSTKPLSAFESREAARYAQYRDGNVLQGQFASQPFSSLVRTNPKVAPGQIIDYYARINPPEHEGKPLNKTFAIVQLLDYAQVPVRYNSTDLAYHGSVADNETCSVYLSVRAPDSPGPHRLVTAVIWGPFEDVETAPGCLNPKVAPFENVEYMDLFVTK